MIVIIIDENDDDSGRPLRDKVKTGWNFFIFTKIAALTPSSLYLYRCIFIRGQLRPSWLGNIPFEWMGTSHLPHALVWENCLTPSKKHCKCFMSFSRHHNWNVITNCYLYGWRSSDPLPSLSLHCKDRKFSPGFDSIPYWDCDQKVFVGLTIFWKTKMKRIDTGFTVFLGGLVLLCGFTCKCGEIRNKMNCTGTYYCIVFVYLFSAYFFLVGDIWILIFSSATGGHFSNVRAHSIIFYSKYGQPIPGVLTQFPESQFYPNPTVKFKFYCRILIRYIILSQSLIWVWVLSNHKQGLFYPIPEILILSTYP